MFFFFFFGNTNQNQKKMKYQKDLTAVLSLPEGEAFSAQPFHLGGGLFTAIFESQKEFN